MQTTGNNVTCPICGEELGMTAVVGELVYQVRYCPTASSGPVQAANELRGILSDGHVLFALRGQGKGRPKH
jgi:hypothetical protein